MEKENPDVEEVRRYNREGCKHTDTEVEQRSMAVGAGPGVIGCHMEQYWVEVCKECHKELKHVLSPAWQKVIDSALKYKLPFPTCVIEPKK